MEFYLRVFLAYERLLSTWWCKNGSIHFVASFSKQLTRGSGRRKRTIDRTKGRNGERVGQCARIKLNFSTTILSYRSIDILSVAVSTPSLHSSLFEWTLHAYILSSHKSNLKGWPGSNSLLLNTEWIYLIAIIKWKSIRNATFWGSVMRGDLPTLFFNCTHSLSHLMPLEWVLFYSNAEISRIEYLNHKSFTGLTFSPFFSLDAGDTPKYFVTQHQMFTLSGCKKNKPCTCFSSFFSLQFPSNIWNVMCFVCGGFSFLKSISKHYICCWSNEWMASKWWIKHSHMTQKWRTKTK